MNETVLPRLWSLVSPERLRELTLALVRIPSPTGDSRAVTEFYAQTVRALGVPVEVLEDYPSSPSTIARWGRAPGGPTLTLDGHLDTIHAPHVPPYEADGRIYGRGAGDMKSGIAAMVEALRVLVESGVGLGGNVILATHSLHEAPVGHMEGLRALIARGDVFTHAALVTEGGFDTLAIRGKGQALFEIEITRPGEPLHENVARPRGLPNPLDHAVALAARLLEATRALAVADDPLLGPETFFLGQIHGGDFYNRLPTRAFLNGVHRYWPDKSWAQIEERFHHLLASVERPAGLEVHLHLLSNGLGYEVPPETPLVRALRQGYRAVVGRELPLVGELSVSDVNVIVREAGIPAVGHGTGSTTAHADLEWVSLADIVRTTKVYLATIVAYLGIKA
jgi:acetylornithine deacetylase/succinyl-diaminopimelate desuccinylase-like protein